MKFCRIQENVFMVCDGIGDLSHDISENADYTHKSTVNIITMKFIFQLKHCEMFLSLHFSFSAIKHDVKFIEVHAHSNKHSKNNNGNNTIQVITWPHHGDAVLHTVVNTQGFLLSTKHKTFKITFYDFSYTGLFSSHAKDIGGM